MIGALKTCFEDLGCHNSFETTTVLANNPTLYTLSEASKQKEQPESSMGILQRVDNFLVQQSDVVVREGEKHGDLCVHT